MQSFGKATLKSHLIEEGVFDGAILETATTSPIHTHPLRLAV